MATIEKNLCRLRPDCQGLSCDKKPNACHKCGWNPEVEERRKSEFHQEQKIMTIGLNQTEKVR